MVASVRGPEQALEGTEWDSFIPKRKHCVQFPAGVLSGMSAKSMQQEVLYEKCVVTGISLACLSELHYSKTVPGKRTYLLSRV